MIAVDTRRPVEFILPAELSKPAEEQTRFEIRVLPVRQRPTIIKLAKSLQNAQPKLATADGVNADALAELIESLTELCRIGLAGWSNMRGSDGGVVKFEEGETALDALDLPTLADIAGEIVRVNTLQGNERGN